MASSSEQGSSRESTKRKRIALANDESCLNGKKAPREAKFIKKINDDDRAALAKTFSKRNPTVMKKTKELQTLCDVSVCMICYGPNGDLVTWPENRADVENMILTYKAMNVREKGRVSLLGYLESKKRKLEEKKNKNNGGKFNELIANLEKCLAGLSGDALTYTQNYMNFKLKGLKEKIEFQVNNARANVGNCANVDNKDSIMNTNTSGAVLPEHFRLDATNCSTALTNIKFDNSNTPVEITGWPWDAETISDQDCNPYIDSSQYNDWLWNEFQRLANCQSPGSEGGSNFPRAVSQADTGFAESQHYFNQVNTSDVELENLGGAAKRDNILVVPGSNQTPLLHEAFPMSMWMLRPLV